MSMKTNLKGILEGSGFAVLAAAPAVCGTDLSAVSDFARLLKGKVTAVFAADNPGARVSASALAVSVKLLAEGVEPVLCMTTRDRNRLALESDLLGAGALGIANVQIVNGAHPSLGSHPSAHRVYDVDAVQWIAAATRIASEKTLISGEAVSGDPSFFIGAAANPFVKTPELHLPVLKKKVAAGARFLVTAPVFDAARLATWLDNLKKSGVTCPVIATVAVLPDAATARHLARAGRGMAIPDSVIARIEKAGDKSLDEAIAVAVENIQAVKALPGIRGVAIIAPGSETAIPRVMEAI